MSFSSPRAGCADARRTSAHNGMVLFVLIRPIRDSIILTLTTCKLGDGFDEVDQMKLLKTETRCTKTIEMQLAY